MMRVEDVRLIDWNESYEIGVYSIDQQHKQLTVLMNDLARLVIEKSITPDKLNFIIAELVDFTVYHLDFEADCMFRFDYDDVLLHLEQHELFKEKLNLFRKKISEKKDADEIYFTVINMWHFLNIWLCEHIVGSDKDFVPLFHANGMK